MSVTIRLLNVNFEEFEEFYAQLHTSSQRMSRHQMLQVADMLHEKIRERRGQEAPIDFTERRDVGLPGAAG